jgi:hypothetical protein
MAIGLGHHMKRSSLDQPEEEMNGNTRKSRVSYSDDVFPPSPSARLLTVKHVSSSPMRRIADFMPIVSNAEESADFQNTLDVMSGANERRLIKKKAQSKDKDTTDL